LCFCRAREKWGGAARRPRGTLTGVDMLRRHSWIVLAMAMATAIGCFSDSGGGGDDDDSGGGIHVDCNPTACEAIAGPEDCEQYVNIPDMATACQYCLSNTLHDDQVAECILDYRDQATGEELVNGCIAYVEEQCVPAKDHADQ
jgi:hypothetical protein